MARKPRKGKTIAERIAKENEAQRRRIEKEHKRAMASGVHSSKKPSGKKAKVKKPEPYRRPSAANVPSFSGDSSVTVTQTVSYTGEMAEREKAAQKEIERKKRRTAPLYNKGGYQYVTDETDLSDLGRKK